MEDLINQIINNGFKPSLFSIYNYIEDEGFILELKHNFNINFGIEDFEYILLKISEKDKNGIKYRMKSILSKFEELKNFIEIECQENKSKPKSKVYINKDGGFVFIVKLKEFNLIETIKQKNGNKQASSLPNNIDVVDC